MRLSEYKMLKEKEAVTIADTEKGKYCLNIKQYDPLTGVKKDDIKVMFSNGDLARRINELSCEKDRIQEEIDGLQEIVKDIKADVSIKV